MTACFSRLAIERDDRQRVMIGGRLFRCRYRLPALMGKGGNVDSPHVMDGGLHIGNIFDINTIVDPQRRIHRALRVSVLRRDIFLLPVRPVRLQTHAVMEPPFKRTTAARTVIIFPGVFVVSPGKVVKHAGAH